MSPREKKLLTFFAIAGFVMANFIGFSFYNKKAEDVKTRLQRANADLDRIWLVEQSREQNLSSMQWLERHLPEPAEFQNVQTALQTYCEAEAARANLQFNELPPERRRNTDETKVGHFERVEFRLKLTGSERNLYKWLDRVYLPDQMRVPTKLLLSPNKEDDSLIDCTATVQQWYIPVAPSI